ncbi:hypothetical protein BCV69DRAFT_314247 [Microstroma glucosiphilum]|uniref:Galactose oxidase n=1 Tax=Pseudomicrostroma glucosiphilum TaxID=1684307 RepID=A0A316U0Y7_9BASI|nr:hypothetical protein BCV69DRAFT_314247 [Pseudomicrostroma glucosiphilum]PWN19062.1 hypothetical protein BCV69DRAFT_314247 [Pseudomicrostroma glucosiphilum]
MLLALSPSQHRDGRRKRGRARLGTWGTALLVGGFAIAACQTAQAQTTTAVARWGQASALLSSLFVVYGGQTADTSGTASSYTSGTLSADLLLLDLNSSFSVGIGSPAPWQTVALGDTSALVNAEGSRTTAPTVAFGSLAPLTHRQVLLFGGSASAAAVQTGTDSTYTFQLIEADDATYSATWELAPAAWSQPTRRIYQSMESDGRGGVWIMGGQREDSSSAALDEAWTFNHSSSSPLFNSLAAPTGSLVGATATLLSDDTILFLGGEDSTGALQAFDSVVTYDTTSNSWSSLRTRGVNGSSSAVPVPRRGHVAVSLPNQRIFLHGGSSTADLTTPLDDAWILDWSVSTPRWTQIPFSNIAPTARFGHSAVAYGSKVLMTLGWAGTAPADVAVYAFDASTMVAGSDGTWSGGSWISWYTPDATVVATTDTTTGQTVTSGDSTTSSGSTANNVGGNGSSTSSGGTPKKGSDRSSGSASTTSSSSSASSSTSSSPSSSSAKAGHKTSSSAKTSTAGAISSTKTPTPAAPDDNSKSQDLTSDDGSKGSSAGAKAGAAIGVLLGVGLVVAAGYVLYNRRKQKKRLAMWQYGKPGGEDGYGASGAGGGAGLLGGAAAMGYEEGGYAGDEKDHYPAPPSSQGHNDGSWSPPTALFPSVFGSVRSKKPEGLAPLHVYGNIGRDAAPVSVSGGVYASHHSHATEGSGPGVREKLAMLTGLNGWSQHGHQQRFDMLADEDAEAAYGAHDNRSSMHHYGNSEDVAGDVGGYTGGYDYQKDDVHDGYDDYDNAYSPEGLPYDSEQGAYHGQSTGVRSVSGAAAGFMAAVRTVSGSHRQHAHQRLPTEEEDYVANEPYDEKYGTYARNEAVGSELSYQSTVRKSNRGTRPSSIRDSIIDGFTSLPEKSSNRRNSIGQHSQHTLEGSSSMKRSSSWWDRVMSGSSILDRTSSGRLAVLPSARDPIRDPALPPSLSTLTAIKESPRSVDPSEDRSTFDGPHTVQPTVRAIDNNGHKRKAGRVGEMMLADGHGRSQSSLQSGTSSQLEAQLRDMDVAQRTRTGSGSDMTVSTKKTRRTNNSSATSRGTSSVGLPQPVDVMGDDARRRDSSYASQAHAPRYEIGDVSHASVGADADDTAAGGEVLADLSLSAISESDGLGADESRDLAGDFSSPSPFDDRYASRKEPSRRSLLPRSASEVPSITPLTTKRARANPRLTNPSNPLPKNPQAPPLVGSVKDRVEAIERRKSELLAAATAGSGSGSTGGSLPASPSLTEMGYEQQEVYSATPNPGVSVTGTPLMGKVSHGLVPKPQLFVANPDHARRNRAGRS